MYFTGSTEPSRSDHPSPPPPPPPPPATSVRPLGDGDVWPTGVALPPTPRVVKRQHRCCPPRYARPSEPAMTAVEDRLAEIEARAAAARSRASQNWPTASDVHDQVDAVDELLAALRAVLALHKPDRAGDPEDTQCDGCLDIDPGGYVPWPCPTVRAITAVRGVTP